MLPHDPGGIAVIGCGHWGSNYLRILSALGRRPLVCSDTDPVRLTKLASQHPGIEIETETETTLERDDVTAVIIATTASTHAELVRSALERGKDVLVEKPFTVDPASARELTALARERSAVLMVAHTFLYNAAVRHMKDLIGRGEAGSIYYLHARRTHLGLIRRDVSALWDLAPHDVSIFNYLLDLKPLSVTAQGGPGSREEGALGGGA